MRTHARTEISDLKGSFLAELKFNTFWRMSIRQEDGVTIWVLPVIQHVVLNLSTVTQSDAGIAKLLWPRIHLPRVHGHIHASGGNRFTVGCLISKGRAAGLIIGNIRNLKSSPAAGTRDLPKLRVGDWTSGQDVAVRIRVIVQDGKRSGSTGANAEVVINRIGRSVLLFSLWVCDLIRDLRRVLLLFLLFKLRFDLVPIVHQDHVVFGHPDRSRCGVIENNTSAVCSKNN